MAIYAAKNVCVYVLMACSPILFTKFLYVFKGYKMVHVSVCCDINTLGAVEQERSCRETRGIFNTVRFGLRPSSAIYKMMYIYIYKLNTEFNCLWPTINIIL